MSILTPNYKLVQNDKGQWVKEDYDEIPDYGTGIGYGHFLSNYKYRVHVDNIQPSHPEESEIVAYLTHYAAIRKDGFIELFGYDDLYPLIKFKPNPKNHTGLPAITMFIVMMILFEHTT